MNRAFSSGSGPGWLLILLGLSLNRWTLGWTLAPDGTIESTGYRLLIHAADAVLILIGGGLLKRKVSFSDLFSLLRRAAGLERCRVLRPAARNLFGRLPIKRVAGLILPWIVLASVLIILEAAAYLTLTLRSPELARKTARRHVLVGSPERLSPGDVPVQDVIAFHPLHGWFYRSRRPDRDRHGFRVNDSSETASLDPSAALRVFLLGGSTAAGQGVTPEETITAHLERLMEAWAGRPVDVVNAGVGGWTAANELSLLTGRILPFFDPDAVVILDGANDVRRAVSAGRQFRRSRPGGPWISRTDNYLYDPKLRFYRTQFEALREDPLHVFNQLLYALGVRRYLHPGGYFLGGLVENLTSNEPRVRAAFEGRLEALKRQASVRTTSAQRAQFRERIQALPPRRRNAFRRVLERFPPRETTIIKKMLGGFPDGEWRTFRRNLSASPEQIEGMLNYALELFQPDRVDRWLDSLPCRGLPLNLNPYLKTVRSALGASRASGTPIVYALQPTLFRKENRSFAEKIWMRNMRVCTYSGRCFPRFEFPAGTCLDRLFRRFYRRAERAFQTELTTNAASPPTRMIDLSRLFRNERRHLFTDYLHYNDRGNRLIARRLFEVLRSLGPDLPSIQPNEEPPPRP